MTALAPARRRAEQGGWSLPSVQRHYETHRRRREDLYPSERWFLPRLLPRVRSVLDVGCAAGGFFPIMASYNPRVQYTGVDINARFVRTARRSYPGARFLTGDGVRFAGPAGGYDLVHSSGVFHLNSGYREILRSCYRQAKRYLLFDVRLTQGPSVRGRLLLAKKGPGRALPYLVLNVEDFVNDLRSLRPMPRRIAIRGYAHAPADDAVLPLKRVYAAFTLVEKGRGPTRVDLRLDKRPPVRRRGKSS